MFVLTKTRVNVIEGEIAPGKNCLSDNYAKRALCKHSIGISIPRVIIDIFTVSLYCSYIIIDT